MHLTKTIMCVLCFINSSQSSYCSTESKYQNILDQQFILQQLIQLKKLEHEPSDIVIFLQSDQGTFLTIEKIYKIFDKIDSFKIILKNLEKDFKAILGTFNPQSSKQATMLLLDPQASQYQKQSIIQYIKAFNQQHFKNSQQLQQYAKMSVDKIGSGASKLEQVIINSFEELNQLISKWSLLNKWDLLAKQYQENRYQKLAQTAKQKKWVSIVSWIADGHKAQQLVEINQMSQNIDKIIQLDCLKHLTTLNLNDNLIQKIQNLQNARLLVNLNLSHNRITKIENVNYLRQLKTLQLTNNLIQKIQNVEGLQNLQNLYLSKNKIEHIQNLQNLKSLIKLHLSLNKISSISTIHNQKLRELHLNNNNIQKIQGIEKLSKLTVLSLKINKIESISNLIQCQSLQSVHLNLNPITNNQQNIKYLKQLKNRNILVSFNFKQDKQI